MRTRVLASAVLVGLLGCAGQDGEGTDAGLDPDSGLPEAGGSDAGGLDAGGPTPCRIYCDAFMLDCDGHASGYEDLLGCLSACHRFPSDLSDGSPAANTLECRTQRLADPALDVDAACTAASESGGAVCGDMCADYCNMMTSFCPSESAGGFADRAGCLEGCAGLKSTGETGATSGDSLECRLNMARRAASDSTFCVAAGRSGGELCDCGIDPEPNDTVAHALEGPALVCGASSSVEASFDGGEVDYVRVSGVGSECERNLVASLSGAEGQVCVQAQCDGQAVAGTCDQGEWSSSATGRQVCCGTGPVELGVACEGTTTWWVRASGGVEASCTNYALELAR